MGQDKATLPWGNTTLLGHLVSELYPDLTPLIVVGAYQQSLPELPGWATIVHDTQPYCGPLHGLHEGMEAISANRSVLVTGCDYPFVKPALAHFLAAQAATADIVVLEAAGELQPLPALYQTRLLPIVEQLISTGQKSLLSLLRRVQVKVVAEEVWRQFDSKGAMLININTPVEYQAARDSITASTA